MSRSKSSTRWLQEHFNDVFVKKAQIEGYRSRAVYKLKEIDEKEKLIKPGLTVVDLGAAPGGWSQYASKKLNGRGQVFALDILPMDALSGVDFILGDFREEAVSDKLRTRMSAKGIDLVLSDMAPNMSGSPAIDIPAAMYLAELAFDFATQVLNPGGHVLIKVFQGAGFEAFIKLARSQFEKVVIRKPDASRARSRETYMLAKNYKI